MELVELIVEHEEDMTLHTEPSAAGRALQEELMRVAQIPGCLSVLKELQKHPLLELDAHVQSIQGNKKVR